MKKTVIVIGGGPSGMISAGRASENGADVILIEKNEKLGKKLLMCGKGRCNITNAEFEIRPLVEKYGKAGKFLFSALSRFGTGDIIEFLEARGVPTKVERGNRVFPASDKSTDVLKAMEKYLYDVGVKVMKSTSVRNLIVKNNHIEKVTTDNGDFEADNFVIATGGKSYPATGSTGDGYAWLEKMGHKINKPRPALVPIIIKEDWIKRLEGLSLKNVNISVFQNNKKKDERFGEALFTAHGMSGPIILDMSKNIGSLVSLRGSGADEAISSNSSVTLKIDFKPALDFKTLDQRIQRDWEDGKNKSFRNSLDKLLPKKLISVMVMLSGINPEKKVHSITKEERKKLVHLFKEFSLTIKGVGGFNLAIVTTGGVDLKEVDPKTMKSKKIDNLYLTGEVLDLDGPTGGYNLQVAWTTGYIAGENIGG